LSKLKFGEQLRWVRGFADGAAGYRLNGGDTGTGTVIIIRKSELFAETFIRIILSTS
jgi:hypothetical protein